MNGHQETEDFSPYRSDGKLYGFVCIVTGATSPVGRAIVSELAAHGAACVYACSSSTSSDFAALTSEVAQKFPSTKIIGYPFKLANEEDTLTLIDDVLNAWGRLDVYITNPALLGPPSLSSTTPSDLQRVLESNSLPPFFALKYAPAAMSKTTPKGRYPNAAPKSQAYGSIVVVSSIASTTGGCWGPAFTMSCHAALGVVRAGVAALKGTGVRINCVSAGQVDVGIDLKGIAELEGGTGGGGGVGQNQHQLPPASLQSREKQREIVGLERAGLPQEVARVAGFLASGFSSYVTGANMVVDGGSSVMNPLTVPI